MRMSKASKLFSAALAVSFASSCFADDSGDRVATVLKNTPLIDGHNDVPWQYFKRVDNQIDRMDLAADLTTLDDPTHTDIPRLREGGVGGLFFLSLIHI